MSEEDSAVVAAPAMEDAPLKDKEEEKQNLADGSDDEESQDEAPRRSTRERKAYVEMPLNVEVKEKAELEIVPGKGTPLGDIPNVAQAIASLKGVDDILRKFYRTIFRGHQPNKLTIKKHLRQYSGSQPDEKELLVQRFSAMELGKELKPICQLLDINVGGTKEAVVQRIVDFLEAPEASGGSFGGKPGSSSKRKRSTKSEGKSKSKSGTSKTKKSKSGSSKDKSKKEKKEKKKKSKESEDDEESEEESSSESESSEEEEGSDAASGGDEDDDMPISKVKEASVKSRIEAAVKKIVSEGDLDTLTKKMIRGKIVSDFGLSEEVVEAHKDLIAQVITKITS